MGYTTEFDGSFAVTPTLKPEHAEYLRNFNRTRRMKRDEHAAEAREDKVRVAAALPIGSDGSYFVGEQADFGQAHTPDITDYNDPPVGQPGLWCKWTPNDDGSLIEWDSGEKFYFYIEWLEYLIGHFLAPWGYSLTGSVKWQGEDRDDRGILKVKRNQVSITHLR